MRLRFEKCMNSRVYKNPYQYLNDYYVIIDRRIKQIENSVMKKLKDSKIEAAKVITKLDTLSPLKTLSRGYSITELEGKIVNSVNEIKQGDIIDIHFKDGNAKAKIQ